jgi:hypothetical protein
MSLESLALARFTSPPLTDAETKLLRAAPTGDSATCWPLTPTEADYDPGKADQWDAQRNIRADLIRWICVDRQARELVDPKGIQIYGAKIPDALDLSDVKVPFPLGLWSCRLAKELSLRHVEMPLLDLRRTWVSSIDADGAVVKGSVYLGDGFRAEGEVRFLGAQIGNDLDCSGGVFHNPSKSGVKESGTALFAPDAVVKENVFLRDDFRADGDVRLIGMQVGGNLECDHATFDGTLLAQRAVIRGGFYWSDLRDARLAKLNLTNASIGVLNDDKASWPSRTNLCLDGFVYTRISQGPWDAKTRLEWLALLAPFATQPYRQLAKVLKEEGDDAGGRKVLYEMEHTRRTQEKRNVLSQAWGVILRGSVGYGYYPGNAIWGLLVLTSLAFALFRAGYLAGNVVPTDKDAYIAFTAMNRGDGIPPSNYVRFAPFVYALENSLPLVKLGQADRWQPDPNPASTTPRTSRSASLICGWVPSAPFLRCFLWFQIVLGWVLATLFAAGVTGIVRKD